MTIAKTHILHVIPAIAPRYGGPSLAIRGMCQSLRAVGVRCVVATTDADGRGRLPVTLGRIVDHDGTATIFFKRSMGEAFKWSHALATWLDAHVTEFAAVHIHAVFSHASIAAGRACRRHGVPYIVRPLGTLDPWSLSRKRLRKLALYPLGVRALLEGAAALHYTSAQELALAEQAGAPKGRGIVVPLGIDDGLFGEGAADGSGSPYVLSLSRIDEKKGIDLLIDAFARATAQRPETTRLVIAGDGTTDQIDALRARAQAVGVTDRVDFVGWVTGAVKQRWLHNATLFAAPSTQENFGLGIVEAMASGVPVLVTPGVNLASEIRTAAAGWVAERRPDALADALAQALRDERERSRRGANARAFARQFRWEAIAPQLVDLYRRAG